MNNNNNDKMDSQYPTEKQPLKLMDVSDDIDTERQRRTPIQFFVKYFLYGQQLTSHEKIKKSTNLEAFDSKLLKTYRQVFSFLIPFIIAQFVWWSFALRFNFFPLYQTHYHMPLTMIFGGIVAGMTAEGGGAIAYPVMTFILYTTSKTARDFSLMIQATGMSLAFFAILFMKIQVEWRAITYALMGAFPGFVLGYHTIDLYFDGPTKKMMFVSIWMAFAFALYILNKEKKRLTVAVIEDFKLWKSLVLILTGFIGGIFTSFAGSGVDICIFSMITLLFRVTEKTATPSTVIAMALTSQFSVFWISVVENDLDPIALDYLKVSAPVVVFCAPFGSFLGSHFHRLTLAWLVCILEIVAYCGFLASMPSLYLLGISAGILSVGLVFFNLISIAGKKLITNSDNNEIEIVCKG